MTMRSCHFIVKMWTLKFKWARILFSIYTHSKDNLYIQSIRVMLCICTMHYEVSFIVVSCIFCWLVECFLYTVTGARWSYSNWASGQPDNTCPIFCSNTDCVLMRSTEGYRWKDYPCSSTRYHYAYICEYGRVTSSCRESEWLFLK